MGMDSELIARISLAHRRRLAWFEEHQGEVSAFPGPLANGTPLLLVSKPKGIYKPGNLAYALSIRITLDSPYADDVPSRRPAAAGCCPITRKAPTRRPATRCSPTGA
jgi:hypothetical protein